MKELRRRELGEEKGILLARNREAWFEMDYGSEWLGGRVFVSFPSSVRGFHYHTGREKIAQYGVFP